MQIRIAPVMQQQTQANQQVQTLRNIYTQLHPVHVQWTDLIVSTYHGKIDGRKETQGRTHLECETLETTIKQLVFAAPGKLMSRTLSQLPRPQLYM